MAVTRFSFSKLFSQKNALFEDIRYYFQPTRYIFTQDLKKISLYHFSLKVVHVTNNY